MQAETSQSKPRKISSNFKPKLLWNLKEGTYQTDPSFLKQFPKYFAQKTIECKSLQNGKVSLRVKSAKMIRSLAVAERSPFRLENHPFIKLLLKKILNTYRRCLKRFASGRVYGLVYYSDLLLPRFVRHIPECETYCLDLYDRDSWRDFLFLKNLKELELVIESHEKTVKAIDIFSWRFADHLSLLTKLKSFILKYDLRTNQHHQFYLMLSQLNQFNFSLETFAITVERNPYGEGLSVIEEDLTNVFQSVTHLKMEFHSNLFFVNIDQFSNLISLQTDLFSNKDPENDIAAFFTSVSQLKKLKSLALRAQPKILPSNPGIGCQRIQDFLQNFALPENLEHITLALAWFKLYKIIPCTHSKELYLHQGNPLEEHQICRDFADQWKNLEKLKSLKIRITNGWDQGYILNRYLAFMILSKVPRLEKIRYYQSIYESGTGDVRAPFDFGLFLNSIKHLAPNIMSLKVNDWEISTKSSFEEMKIEMPKLQKLKVEGRILGGKFFANFPKFILEKLENKKSDFEFTINRMAMENNETFGILLKSLSNLPKGTKLSVYINAWYLDSSIISQMLCELLDKSKAEGVLNLVIMETKPFSRDDVEQLKNRLLKNPSVLQKLKIQRRFIQNSSILNIKNGVFNEDSLDNEGIKENNIKEGEDKAQEGGNGDVDEDLNVLMSYLKV